MTRHVELLVLNGIDANPLQQYTCLRSFKRWVRFLRFESTSQILHKECIIEDLTTTSTISSSVEEIISFTNLKDLPRERNPC